MNLNMTAGQAAWVDIQHSKHVGCVMCVWWIVPTTTWESGKMHLTKA